MARSSIHTVVVGVAVVVADSEDVVSCGERAGDRISIINAANGAKSSHRNRGGRCRCRAESLTCRFLSIGGACDKHRQLGRSKQLDEIETEQLC